RAPQAGGEVLVADLPLRHHVAAEGLVGEVRAAVDGDAVFEQDSFPDLPPPELEDERALVQGVGEEERREGDLQQAPLPQMGDLLQLGGRRNHRCLRINTGGVYPKEEVRWRAGRRRRGRGRSPV